MKTHLLCLALVIPLGACPEPIDGTLHMIEFTPVDCGKALLACSFDDPIVAGGTLDVRLRNLDGSPEADLDLSSSAASVITVTRVADSGGRPLWQLVGGASGGTTRLIVRRSGRDVDSLPVTVREADQLKLVSAVGDAIGPTYEVRGSATWEVWKVKLGKTMVFQVVPFSGPIELMGQLRYTRDPEMPLSVETTSPSAIENGVLYINSNERSMEYRLLYDHDGLHLGALLQTPAS